MATNPSPYAPPAGVGGGAAVDPALADYYRNYLPEAGFWSFLQGKGLVGSDPQSRFTQNRYSNYYGQYLAAAANEPNLGFYDYLNRGSVDPGADFMAQSPDQRMDFSSRTLTPRVRWATK